MRLQLQCLLLISLDVTVTNTVLQFSYDLY